MRAPAVSFANKLWAATLAALLTFTLVPASAFAKGEGDSADVVAEEPQEVGSEQVDEGSGSGSAPAASPADGRTLVSALVGTPTAFINSDVALDSEPIVGSFTVDGMTFAVTKGSDVELVGVSPDWQQVTGSQEGDGSPVAPMLASGPEGLALALPGTITYEGIDYAVISIGAYAFYLSGVTAVELPASIAQIDDRAFRSSNVAAVEIAEGNESYSSFDGALYDADQLSLLLIPEGKQGTVLLPKTAEMAPPSVFSHCSLVQAIAVEEGSAAFASENGLLYDASLTTLLRVPAGATDIVIRDGCTTIAAGAMEACASLATITAPASVASISPDVFTSMPTISLPAVAVVADDPGASTGVTEEPSEQADSTPASDSASTQLTAMVALSSTDDDLPEVDPAVVEVFLISEIHEAQWQMAGFTVEPGEAHVVDFQSEALYGADTLVIAYARAGGYLYISSNNENPNHMGKVSRALIQTGATSLGITVSGASFTLTADAFRVAGKAYANAGYSFAGWNENNSDTVAFTSKKLSKTGGTLPVYAVFQANPYTIILDPNGKGVTECPDSISAVYDTQSELPVPKREGYTFKGWDTSVNGDGVRYQDSVINLADTPDAVVTLYAQWELVKVDISFDTSTEPGDKDYPGEIKDDLTIVGDQVMAGDEIVIEDPKRPGYVFQGWVIPDADGEHAIDQDLVYQDEADGKWYVDASKLPDYANDEGRVELTARWTSVISVDVPSAATFYYDLVTDQSGEAHEAALSGTTSFSSQSQVDLRVCGLESVKAEGADSLFASGADGAVMSVYPATGGNAVTVEGAQGAAGAKPASAVDFALDDVVLEGAFAKAGADAFAIPAGDDLTLTYRLNLGTGATLDYDKILAMAEGDEASLASLTYTFAVDSLPVFWTYDDDGRMLNVYAIKADAEAIAAGDAAVTAKYTDWMNADHRFYVRWFDKGVTEANARKEDDSMVYEVRIIGINHDAKADGAGTAGITFEFVNLLIDPYCMNFPTCGTVDHYGNRANVFNSTNKGHEFDTWDTYTVSGTYTHNVNSGGWGQSLLRAQMNPGIETNLNAGSVGLDDDAIWKDVPEALAAAIVPVKKSYFDNSIGFSGAVLRTSSDRLFLLSLSEVVANTNTFPSGWGGLISEGSVYQFYKNHQTIGNGDNAILVKYRTYPDGSLDEAPYSWWFRSPNPSCRTSFAHISIDGEPHTAVQPVASYMLGTAPCFCL